MGGHRHQRVCSELVNSWLEAFLSNKWIKYIKTHDIKATWHSGLFPLLAVDRAVESRPPVFPTSREGPFPDPVHVPLRKGFVQALLRDKSERTQP
jgi:hypothetical protein